MNLSAEISSLLNQLQQEKSLLGLMTHSKSFVFCSLVHLFPAFIVTVCS